MAPRNVIVQETGWCVKSFTQPLAEVNGVASNFASKLRETMHGPVKKSFQPLAEVNGVASAFRRAECQPDSMSAPRTCEREQLRPSSGTPSLTDSEAEPIAEVCVQQG